MLLKILTDISIPNELSEFKFTFEMKQLKILIIIENLYALNSCKFDRILFGKAL